MAGWYTTSEARTPPSAACSAPPCPNQLDAPSWMCRARADRGSRELVRALGVEVLSSADVLASVVAAWDAADIASHERAAQALERGKDGLFWAIKGRLAMRETWTEYDAQQHLVR